MLIRFCEDVSLQQAAIDRISPAIVRTLGMPESLVAHTLNLLTGRRKVKVKYRSLAESMAVPRRQAQVWRQQIKVAFYDILDCAYIQAETALLADGLITGGDDVLWQRNTGL